MRMRVAAGFLLLAATTISTTSDQAAAEGLFDLLLGGAQPSAAGSPADSGTLTVHRRHARPAAPRVSHLRAERTDAAHKPDAGHKAEVAIDPSKVADWYLRDRTLRRGDIVVLKGGALVYVGRGGVAARRAADFARVRDAHFLSARTRDFVAKATAVNAYTAAGIAPPKPKVRPSAT